MKVALLAPRSARYTGALERHIRELANGLARRGAAVEVLSDGHDAGLRRAARLFDIVHVHCTHPLVALAAARARPERLVFSPLAPMARLLRWPHGGATRAAVYVATETLCMSRAEAALLCRALPTAANRVRVVPQGVDTGAIRDASPFPAVSPLVLAVGRLVRYKRVDRAIAAMAGLVPTFELVVIGDGPARRRLKAYAADLQVSSRVRFAGQVSDADLHRWLRTARLLVALSEQEAFGLQVLEGVAAGTPVVASDIPAHREAASFARAGVTFVSPEGSPLEVADAISIATEDPVVAADAPLPSWGDVVDATLEVYEGLMRSGVSTEARRAREARAPEHDGQGELVVEGRR
jgi:glycosyltransferase involved in cell wall biosynthesis